MTLSQFNVLPYEQQLALVFADGAYVVTRWQEVYEAVLRSSTSCRAASSWS